MQNGAVATLVARLIKERFGLREDFLVDIDSLPFGFQATGKCVPESPNAINYLVTNVDYGQVVTSPTAAWEAIYRRYPGVSGLLRISSLYAGKEDDVLVRCKVYTDPDWLSADNLGRSSLMLEEIELHLLRCNTGWSCKSLLIEDHFSPRRVFP